MYLHNYIKLRLPSQYFFRFSTFCFCNTNKTIKLILVYYYYQEFMRAMRLSNPSMRALADQMEREEVVRWANSLSRARVTRWGGMISTPDDVLQVISIFDIHF